MRLYNYLVALPRAEDYCAGRSPGWVRFRKARARLDAVVYRMIAERRAKTRIAAICFPCCWAGRDEGEKQPRKG